MKSNFLLNPKLELLKDNWQGNPLDKRGRFVNNEFPFQQKFGDVWKWQTQRNPQKLEKKSDFFQLNIHRSDEFMTSKDDGICWLGHASFLIRINGKLILTDPVFGNVGALLKRKSEIPFSAEKIKNIDYLLISHDHRDHVDQKSLQIFHGNNPKTSVLTGLNMRPLLSAFLGQRSYQEAGWFQAYQLDDDIQIIYLPARHWGRRGLNDTNQRLWGCFLLRTKNSSILFGADSGYGSHYKEINELLGPVDIAILGIGPYKPEWFMSASHTSPSEAVRAAEDLGARYLIPMHYGTFDLADEPLGDPIRTLMNLETTVKIEPLTVGLEFKLNEIIH